jgi:hypothetical protein
MTRKQHQGLQGTIERAKAAAEQTRIAIAVVDDLYCETDEQRWQFAPMAGVEMLYRPGSYGLIGVAFPDGRFENAPVKMVLGGKGGH